MASKSEIEKAAEEEMKRRNGWSGWCDEWVDRAVKEKLLYDFEFADIFIKKEDADDKLGCYGKFSKHWRDHMCRLSSGLPFSTLLTLFHDRYGIPGRGEALVPLNALTHNNDNNPIVDRDILIEEENNNNNPELDFDATEEILRRLPLPSLMRAKSVCKAWKTAIAASNFNLSDETEHFVTQDSHHGINLFCAALNEWFEIPLPRYKSTYDCYRPQSYHFYLLAAAAGLFLFLDNIYGRTVIINLSTKQQRVIPHVESWWVTSAYELIVHAGHFEIISVNTEDRVQLYNSTTDEWKDIPVMADFVGREKHKHPWKSTVQNGMVYFTNNYGHHLGCYDIARRDFRFKEIEGGLPPQIDSHDLDNNLDPSLPALVACNGKLLLVGRLEKEESIWGRFPFIEHTLVGIWQLENNKSWSLISVTPQDLLHDTVKSSHGTDFMVAASDRIWLTIKGSRNLLTLNLSSMEWSVLPGYTAQDLVNYFPSRAVCGSLRISHSLSLSNNQ